MRILGIDPGSRICGYGIIEGGGATPKVVTCGVIKPPATSDLPPRLKFLYESFSNLIREFAPQEVAVENVFFSENARSALILGQARAAAILPGLNAGLQVFEYAPNEIKKAATGRGKAPKEMVAEMVCRLLGLKERPKPVDATDALAIALCHLNTSQVMRKVVGQ